MAPQTQAVSSATQAWLQSSWNIQVPFAWLEACVEWVQEEAGGAGRLSQRQINQQVLDQWLLTDLRDLDHPVLPGNLSEAQKTELNGTFCVQVDMLLDVSQPAYGQLQKWKGRDCSNNEVSAVTQTTQRPWEAKPTRMLLLQITDGVQNLEAMEYQTIPSLSADLRPGVKVQLQGKIICRLGMLLLGPSHVKVLGGEVEDLVERNNLGRVLCRTLGLPEEEQQQQQQQQQPEQGDGEASLAPQQVNHEVDDLDLEDAELLASLEAQEDIVQMQSVQDSGYRTHSDIFMHSSRGSSVRSVLSAASSRSEASSHTNRTGLIQNSRGGSLQEDPDHAAVLSSDQENQMVEDFPDEDFDELLLEELNAATVRQTPTVATQSSVSHRNAPQDNRTGSNPNRFNSTSTGQMTLFQQHTSPGSGSRFLAAQETPAQQEFDRNDAMDFTDEDMECFFNEEESSEAAGGQNLFPVKQGFGKDQLKPRAETTGLRHSSSHSSDAAGSGRRPHSDSRDPVPTPTSAPFTYLCQNTGPNRAATEIRVKAFIVTLLGKLSSSNRSWSVCATVSDGTGYLDVELSDAVLTGLLGFSVAEKTALKRDPARRSELEAGMRRCQEELVDMCCIMTIKIQPQGGKAVVTKVEQVSEKVLQELETRGRHRRK